MSIKQIRIEGLTIDAHFRISRRAKYLSIRLGQDNRIDVVMPPGFKLERAESFLIQKSAWIKKHLKMQPAVKFLFFGKQMEVTQDYNLFAKTHHIFPDGDKLIITSPSGSSLKPEPLFEIWLKHEAKRYLPLRTSELAHKANLSCRKITIKGQRTRWGSCSSKKNISFNYRLMKFRKEIIDYVIIHELCHLKEMNHSVRFWQLVEGMCPDYKKLKEELNTHRPG